MTFNIIIISHHIAKAKTGAIHYSNGWNTCTMSHRVTQYSPKGVFLKGLYRTVSLPLVEKSPTTKNVADNDDRRQKMAAVGKEEKAVGSKGSSRAGSYGSLLWRGSTFYSGSGCEPEMDNNCIPIQTDRVAIQR